MPPPLHVRFSRRSREDLARIAAYWQSTSTDLVPAVFAAINERVEWISAGNHFLGTPLPGLSPRHRVVRERRFGYSIYYRVDGDHADTVTILTIRHGRQRALRPATIARLGRA